MDNDQNSVASIDLMVVDIHGTLRGKRLPVAQQKKITDGAVRLPLSTLLQDSWGNDNDDITGLGVSVGDPDGMCMPGSNATYPTPWNPGVSQTIASMYTLDGNPYFADPRLQLSRVMARFAEHGLTPVVAAELEFYILDNKAYLEQRAAPPVHCIARTDQAGPLHLYDMRGMDRMQDVLDKIHEYTTTMGLPADGILSEFGPGQLEVNLKHCDDALRAADDATLLKRTVENAARACGYATTFMAKPYAQYTSSGMHIHVSLTDSDGNNIFDGGQEPDQPNDMLQFAVAGVLNNMHAMQAICAPLANSYKRLRPDNFAPTHTNWSYDHRGVSVRLPVICGQASRLEFRTPGADANPYLVIASMLSAVLDGLEKANKPKTKPVMPQDALNGEPLSHDWLIAIETMADSHFIKKTFGEQFQKVYTDVKRAEARYIAAQVTDIELQSYLGRF